MHRLAPLITGAAFENNPTLIKKKIKFSSYIRKFRMEQLQSHIWLTASSYMVKYLRISSYIRKPFIIYSMTLQLLHFEFPYIRGKFDFFYISVQLPLTPPLGPSNNWFYNVLREYVCFCALSRDFQVHVNVQKSCWKVQNPAISYLVRARGRTYSFVIEIL